MEDDYSMMTSPANGGSTLQSLLSLRAHVATTLFTSQVYYHLIETLFFLLIIYLVFTRAYKPWARNTSAPLSAAERAARLAAWKPAPLSAAPDRIPSSNVADIHIRYGNFNEKNNSSSEDIPNNSGAEHGIDVEIESGGAGPVVQIRGHGEAINVATCNFLGLLKDKRVEKAALEVMEEYGCGACGPRGFYGTTDVHLECEAALGRFCGTPSAILYSFGAATASSTIPAFVKRGDLLVVDDALGYSLRLGAQLSRAHVLTFRHNDMCSLHGVLSHAVEKEKKRARTQRRLIVVEAISSVYGDICPVDEVVRLKDEFGFRVLVDESLSFGVLGASGHGALQEFDLRRSDVEIMTADLGNAVASVGGVCVGADDVVDHQRLSGAGYCFSASQPPFLAKAATTAVEILERDGASLVAKLRERILAFRDAVGIDDLRRAAWRVDGHPHSPIIYFRRQDNDFPAAVFAHIQLICLKEGVLLARPLHVPGDPLDLPRDDATAHAVRVSLSAALTLDQVAKAAAVVRAALLEIARKHGTCNTT